MSTSEIEQIVRDLQAGIGEPVWEPLEQFCRTALYSPDTVAQFMFMGAALGPEGDRIIYLYKHGMTRRYVNLDAELRTYEYLGDHGGPDAFGNPIYREIRTNEAIHRLNLDALPRLGVDKTTPYNAEFCAQRDQALRDAGWTVVAPGLEEDA